MAYMLFLSGNYYTNNTPHVIQTLVNIQIQVRGINVYILSSLVNWGAMV